MKFNNDTKELIKSYALSTIECFKVFIACLLSVFVPQACVDPKQPNESHTCTLHENFSDLSSYNLFVVVFNFITLFTCLIFYYLQSKRETYFITHLEADKDSASNALQDNLKNYERILGRVRDHNENLYICTVFSFWLFCANLVFSSVLIFHFYYDGFRSVTTLITNFMLVIGKLYSTWDICSNCRGGKTLALSCTLNEPTSFNNIDPDYIKKIEMH